MSCGRFLDVLESINTIADSESVHLNVHSNVHSNVYTFDCTNSKCAIRIYYDRFRICILKYTYLPVTKKFWHFFFDEFCNHFMIGFISAMNNTVAKLLSLLNRWTQPFTQWTIGILKCIEEKVLQPFCDQLYIYIYIYIYIYFDVQTRNLP